MHKHDFKFGKEVLFVSLAFSEVQLSNFECFGAVLKITIGIMFYQSSE